MSLFSKFRAQTIAPMFKRYVRFPNEGMPKDPRPYIEEFAQEPHAEHLGPIINLMLWVVLPAFSVYFWYREINHIFIHPERPRHPKQDFVNQGINRYPWGDGKHSAIHHEYFNFTPYGYETDKDGNRLPPGQYADE